MAAPKAKKEGKVHNFVDHILHGEDDQPPADHSSPDEADLPVDTKPSNKKVSVGRGASSDSKHQHRKFDKFK